MFDRIVVVNFAPVIVLLDMIMTINNLKDKMVSRGIFCFRKLVNELQRLLDPDGVEGRRKGKLKRRKYQCRVGGFKLFVVLLYLH